MNKKFEKKTFLGEILLLFEKCFSWVYYDYTKFSESIRWQNGGQNSRVSHKDFSYPSHARKDLYYPYGVFLYI